MRSELKWRGQTTRIVRKAPQFAELILAQGGKKTTVQMENKEKCYLKYLGETALRWIFLQYYISAIKRTDVTR